MLDGEALHPPSDSETLSRILNRTAALLQARGCGVFIWDRKRNVLSALKPFTGLNEERLKALDLPVGSSPLGVSVREDKPILLDQNGADDANNILKSLEVQNGVAVPLALERRDENNQVVERRVMGAYCVFDKFYGRPFDMEDARLLGMMARQASAVLVTSQLFWAEVEAGQEIKAILESTSVGLMAMSPKGTVTQVNEAARIALSLDKDGWFGRPYDDLITRHDICDLLSDTIMEGNPPTEPKELSLRVKNDEGEDEERIYRVQMDQIRSEDRQSLGWVMVLENVTDIRRAEQMMAAFVDMIAHELRTPLTSIRGFVATLLQAGEGVFDWPTQEEFLQIVDTEAERLGGMIDEQLNIARIQNGRGLQYQFVPTDIRALANTVFRLQKQSSVWRGHELVVDVPDGFPMIQADDAKLTQVLHNLVGNALKYSPGAGKVTLSARQVDGGYQITVSDQGLGIPKEQLPKMFSQFFRVDSSSHTGIKGTGLGLWLTKHMVVEGHHGRIWVESDYGKGSHFHIFIPFDPSRSQD